MPKTNTVKSLPIDMDESSVLMDVSRDNYPELLTRLILFSDKVVAGDCRFLEAHVKTDGNGETYYAIWANPKGAMSKHVRDRCTVVVRDFVANDGNSILPPMMATMEVYFEKALTPNPAFTRHFSYEETMLAIRNALMLF